MMNEQLSSARVLIVDDEEANVDLLEQLLAHAGYHNVHSTTNSREVSELVATQQPDIVLLDLLMPYPDGFAVMQKLQPLRESEYLPILVLTADATPATRLRALAGGATDFLTKPIERVELLLRLNNLLATRLLHLRLHRQYRALEQVADTTREHLAQREATSSAMTHDLGQPLTVLRSASAMLGRHLRAYGDEHERERELADLIGQAADQLLGLVTELSDLARLQADREPDLLLRPTDLVALVRSEVAGLQASTTTHALQVVTSADDLVGEWDPLRLRRVLANLLSNAIKYSPRGGAIEVMLAEEDAEGERWAICTVADQGIGVPSGDLPRLFEPFFRASNATGQVRGTGLGLVGSRRLVEQHGGTLDLNSQEGLGTRVTVRLPLD
jgi:signal transduction histidine kinase